MSGTYGDMMTPEQARMMYAALLDKLPLNSPAAQSIGAGAGLPLELLSAQPPTDQTAASPVVTEGTAAQLPVPPIPPTPEPSAAPTEAPPDQTDPLGRLRSLIGGGERPSQEDRGRESLMNFFFSMAGSRNPSFFGQLGEAGQALAQADRAARTEARQERQLDVEAAYRAAQEARQLREQLAQEDPNSLQGRFLQARINNLEADARARLTTAGSVASGERLGQGYLTVNPETGQAQMEYPAAQGGPQVRPLAGRPANMLAAEQRRSSTDYAAAERAGAAARADLSRRGIAVSNADAQAAYDRAYNETLRQRAALRQQGINPDTQTSASTEQPSRPRIDSLGRPIQ